MIIKDLEFFCTSYSCPEQYEVYDKSGKYIAYVRLRWGRLTCEIPDVGCKMIYSKNIGDDYTGCFASEDERIEHLDEIATVIIEEYKRLTEEERDKYNRMIAIMNEKVATVSLL